MTLTIHLPNDLERRLRERESRHGRSVADYVLGLIERDAVGPVRRPVVDASSVQRDRDQPLSDEAFEILLDDLASGPDVPHLPVDFSRADIYADHD